MARVITINRPDVVALVEEAADRLTDGNKTEAVALALRRLLEHESAHRLPFRPASRIGSRARRRRSHRARARRDA